MIRPSASGGRTGEGGVLTAHGDASGRTVRRGRDRGRRGRPQRRLRCSPPRASAWPCSRRQSILGGRALADNDEGFTLNLGGHLIEDSGSGLTKVFEHVGKTLVHGEVSREMPVWDNDKQTWGSIRDLYSGDKGELKKVIKALLDTSWDELEEWDDRTAAGVDRPAHQRPGRRRPLRVPRRARVPDGRVVRPFGERQPLGAQDALRGEAHGRLLVLARPGLGRHVARPRRRHHRARRRGAPRHAASSGSSSSTAQEPTR